MGSAQRRTPWGFLQHGSVRLRDDTDLYRELTGRTPPPPPALDLDQEAAGDALIAGFSRALAGGLVPGGLSPEEGRIARRLQKLRLSDTLATPGRSLTSFI